MKTSFIIQLLRGAAIVSAVALTAGYLWYSTARKMAYAGEPESLMHTTKSTTILPEASLAPDAQPGQAPTASPIVVKEKINPMITSKSLGLPVFTSRELSAPATVATPAAKSSPIIVNEPIDLQVTTKSGRVITPDMISSHQLNAPAQSGTPAASPSPVQQQQQTQQATPKQ